MGRASKLIVCAMVFVGLLLAGAPSFALDEGASETGEAVMLSTAAMGYDSLDVEGHSGYSTEYIFGMTKGVMRSTLTPVLKPAALIFTVPLDIAFLPFAALAGLLR